MDFLNWLIAGFMIGHNLPDLLTGTAGLDVYCIILLNLVCGVWCK